MTAEKFTYFNGKFLRILPIMTSKVATISPNTLAEPVQLGALTLCGYWISENYRKLVERETIFVHTYRKTEIFLNDDLNIRVVAVPERVCKMQSFG